MPRRPNAGASAGYPSQAAYDALPACRTRAATGEPCSDQAGGRACPYPLTFRSLRLIVILLEVLFTALLTTACGGRSVSLDDSVPASAGSTSGNAGYGGTQQTSGGPYALCGPAAACEVGLSAYRVGSTCFCVGECADDERRLYNASSCPPSPPGSLPPYCNAYGHCLLPCSVYRSGLECPTGLVCGVTGEGLRCVTTAEAIAAADPDIDSTIMDHRLYGACETFSSNHCPNVTGAG